MNKLKKNLSLAPLSSFAVSTLIVSSIIFNSAQAGSTTYSCVMERMVENGENVSFNSSAGKGKVVVDSEWYGKPISLTLLDRKGEVNLILESTQDKIGWLKSDKVTFSGIGSFGGNSLSVLAKMTKSKPLKIEVEFLITKKEKTKKKNSYLICSEESN